MLIKHNLQKKPDIPTFDLYSKEVGTANHIDRTTTFTYDLRTVLENAQLLQEII